jgi:hypothetical protein
MQYRDPFDLSCEALDPGFIYQWRRDGWDHRERAFRLEHLGWVNVAADEFPRRASRDGVVFALGMVLTKKWKKPEKKEVVL